MEELRRKLNNEYLTIGEYINQGLEVFKKIVIKEKLLIAAIVSSTFVGLMIPFVVWIFTLINTVLSFILIGRTVNLIEENEYPDPKDEVLKSAVLTGVCFIAFIIVGVIVSIPLIVIFILNDFFNSIIIAIIFPIIVSGILGITISVLYFCVIPYFVPVYISRNVGIKEAFRINKKLRTGNRMRLFIPTIIISIIGIFIPTLINIPIIGIFIPTLINIPFIKIIFVVILGNATGILSSSVITLIFLNVEYMYNNRINVPAQSFLEDKADIISGGSEKGEEDDRGNDITINDDEAEII